VRGLETFCVACGAPRWPLATVPVNLAGKPAKVGGTIARVLGWVALVGGLAAAIIVGALLQVIFPAGVAGWIVGGVMGALALAVGLALVMGGSKLRLAGVGRERASAIEAISALAARRGGVVTAEEVGRALRLSTADADALLTELAKQGDRVRLEVDDAGQLLYYVDARAPRPRIRVADGVEPPTAPTADEEDDEAIEARARRHL